MHLVELSEGLATPQPAERLAVGNLLEREFRQVRACLPQVRACPPRVRACPLRCVPVPLGCVTCAHTHAHTHADRHLRRPH